ncbi:redox-regulated ATPase YchF [Thermodesulfitimonas sp.]
MEIGLIGLPQVGKTTLFNLLTGANYPTGILGETKVHTGSAPVPDARVDFLAALYRPQKVTCARVNFKDIPGVDLRGGEKGAAIRFFEEVRGADALCYVVRAFTAAGVPPYFDALLPLREFQELYAEILLADIMLVERRLERIRSGKKVSKQAATEVALLERCVAALNEERPLTGVPQTPEEKALFAGYSFLSLKPLLVAVNVDESGLKGGYPQQEALLRYTTERCIPVVEVAARIEAEIAELAPEERAEFLESLGLQEPGIARLARAAYRALGLISFFTVGKDEVKAWTVREGTVAKKAAGKVHSEIERGFIRAEVFAFDDLRQLGSPAKLRDAGLLRLEGKDYVVRDGDIVHFRFKV